MIPLLILSAVQTVTLPFQTVTVNNGTVIADLKLPDLNKGKVEGPFYFESEPIIPPGTKWAQGLPKGEKGWHDGMFPIVDGRTKLDKAQSLGSPMYDYSANKFLPGYWFFWNEKPVGAHNDLVWVLGAGITIKAQKSNIWVRVTGCHWQSVDVYGSDNTINVFVEPGTQSRLINDLASVRVNGHRNTVKGYVRSDMCALWMRGNDNRILDFTGVGGVVGEDSGLVHLYGYGSNGTQLTNVTLVNPGRKYPATWVSAGIYADDLHSRVTTWNVQVVGFKTAFFSHGGSDHNIRNLRAVFCEEGVRFAAHFKTPTVIPTGNRTQTITEIR